MAKLKTKPATAGEKIAAKAIPLTPTTRAFDTYFNRSKLSITIDRAIERAVKKERARCHVIVCVHRDEWIKAAKEIREGVTP